MIARIVLFLTRWHGGIGEGYQDLTVDAHRRWSSALARRSPTGTRRRCSSSVTRSRSGPSAGRCRPRSSESARVTGERGLELAREVDDVILQSAALDALSSLYLADDDYRASHASVLERLSFGDRLDFVERLDARVMDAWHRATLGDLVQANVGGHSRPSQTPARRGAPVRDVPDGLDHRHVPRPRPMGRGARGRAPVPRLVGRARPPTGGFRGPWLPRGDRRRRGPAETGLRSTRPPVRSSRSRPPWGGRADHGPARLRPARPRCPWRDVVADWPRFYGRIDHLDRAIAAARTAAIDLDVAVLRGAHRRAL